MLGGLTKEQYLGTLKWQYDMKDFNYTCMIDSVVHLKAETMVTSYVPLCFFFRTFLKQDTVSWLYKGLTWSRRDTKFLFEGWKISHEWVSYIKTNEIPNNSPFAKKGTIYYVTIATEIFSHVKVTCYFHVWRDHVSRGRTPGVSSMFI